MGDIAEAKLSGDITPICAAYAKVGELAQALGVRNINELEGCWEHQINDQWWIAVNGHKAEVRCSKGGRVPSFECYVEFNGWPAGVIGLDGGLIAAGDEANEDALIAALQIAIQEART